MGKNRLENSPVQHHRSADCLGGCTGHLAGSPGIQAAGFVPRSALFTLAPAIGATVVFAWMVKHLSQPVKKFIILSGILLLLSFIPDYALPLEGKTLLGSSVAAFMHLVAGIVTVATFVTSYRNQVR